VSWGFYLFSVWLVAIGMLVFGEREDGVMWLGTALGITHAAIFVRIGWIK